MLQNINIKYLAFLLFFGFQGFVTHVVLPIPPYLAFMGMGIVLVLFSRMASTRIDATVTLLLLVCFIYFLSSQVFLNVPIKRLIPVLLQFLLFPIIMHIKDVDQRAFQRVLKFLFFTTILIFSLDLVWRLANPEIERLGDGVEEGSFAILYMYKSNSLIYSDTNVMSIHLLCLFFFFLILKRQDKIALNGFWFFILAGLIIFTFSRAGVISLFFGLFLLFYRRVGVISKVVILLVIILAVIWVVDTYNLLEFEDGSFQSKISIFRNFVDYTKVQTAKSLLFGVGLYNSDQVIGIYAHNLFIALYIETGILGLFFYTLFLLLLVRHAQRDFQYILFPVLLASMAGALFSFPLLWSTAHLLRGDTIKSQVIVE